MITPPYDAEKMNRMQTFFSELVWLPEQLHHTWTYAQSGGLQNAEDRQLDDEREKYYYSIISSEKVFSQLIRVNRIEDIIKNKYEKIWNNLHEKKKKLYKKRYMFEIIFNILPEIVCTFCIITVIHKVVVGEYTIGEYTFYSSLFAMLYSQMTMLITNTIKIYDNKMKLENILLINDAPHNINLNP